MSQSINPATAAAMGGPQPLSPFRSGQESLRQVSAFSQAAHITLQTAEGDIVTFSGLMESRQAVASKSLSSPASFRQETTALLVGREALHLSVQGDLSEEELADIVRLIDDLASIAASFFAGDHEAALTAAMNLGEMGSVTSLSATFTRQASVATRYLATHPMPASLENFGEELRRTFPLARDGEGMETPDYGELLRARWQQILAALEETAAADGPEGTASLSSARETAQRMMTRLEDTLARHPGLGPFAAPLASKALTRAAAGRPAAEHAATVRSFALLQQEFTWQFQQWLIGRPGTTAT